MLAWHAAWLSNALPGRTGTIVAQATGMAKGKRRMSTLKAMDFFRRPSRLDAFRANGQEEVPESVKEEKRREAKELFAKLPRHLPDRSKYKPVGSPTELRRALK